MIKFLQQCEGCRCPTCAGQDFDSHGNKKHCDMCTKLNKQSRDRVLQEERREVKARHITFVKNVEKYIKEQDYGWCSDEVMVNDIAFKFGLNLNNPDDMGVIRLALSKANVQAGYNVK